MKKEDLAIQNYKRFCYINGNDYIASEFALEIILKLVEKYNVKSILELGLGIGSISDTVFKYAKLKNILLNYYGTEKHEFCLNALKSNVEDYNKLLLFKELKDINYQKFDFIIIDGQDNSLKEIVNYCNTNAILFIEGDRSDQTKLILDVFPNSKYVNLISLNKNKDYAHGICEPNHYVGGGQLVFINPTFKMNLFWFQQKVATFIKNKIRTYKRK